MNKIIVGIKGLLRKLMTGVREYPLETALCLTYFAIFVFSSSIRTALKGAGLNVDVSQFFVWFFPQFVLCFTLHKFKDRSRFWTCLYYASWFVWIPLLLWASKPNEWSAGISYLLAGIALIIGTERMDNPSFGKNALSVVVKMGEGLLVGIIIWAIIYALVASVDFLFKLSLKEGWYSYPSVFNWLVFTPLLCCSLLNSPVAHDKGENLLRILIDRVVSIALIIYAVILYCYIIRILLLWELPDGGVAYMVLGFLCVALVCYLLRLQLENRHYEWFFKAFPAIAVPPLVLLWVGTLRRVGEYGLTDSRFYLLVLSALVTLFVAMLIKERTRRFQVMALVLAVSAIVFTFIPGIRARDFGIRSQKARLENLLPKVLENGVFPRVTSYSELVTDSIRCKNIEECYGAWKYLMAEMDSVSFNNAYGEYGAFELETWKIRQAKSGSSQGESVIPEDFTPTIWSMKQVEGDIGLGPYTILVHEYSTKEDTLGIAFCDKDNPKDTLLYCPVRKRLDRADEHTPAEDILVYENGQYKAIFWMITDNLKRPVNAMKILLRKP